MSIMILHHNDADGRCSAAIAIKYLKEYTFSWIVRELEYDQDIGEIPDSIRTVYVLDLSFSPDVMRNLTNKYDVIWIDHHITAIKKLDEFKDLIGIRMDGVAACELTWQHFLPERKVPEAVKLIGDRDVWRFKYGDRTRNFHEMFLLLDPPVENGAWSRWFKGLPEADLEFGAVLREAKTRDIQRHIDTHAWTVELTLKDVKGREIQAQGLMANMSDKRQFSEAGDYMLRGKGADFAWLYYEGMMNGNRIRYHSMRSIDYDVGSYAQDNGGGGHFRASGFVETLQFGRQAAESPPT
jgi:oligoribonuclease NrnB/cAMP/cGMP phosphodiesterase (DHH superfamily)